MNVILSRPSVAGLWDRYVGLPPGPKFLLRLKGLGFQATTKTEFVDCLRATGRRPLDGKAWSAPIVTPMLDELRDQGLLTDNFTCPPALLHSVAADAAASEDAEVMAAAIRRILPGRPTTIYSYSSYGPERIALHRLIRLAIYTNDEAQFVAERKFYDSSFPV
jgi:hypothetical protein